MAKYEILSYCSKHGGEVTRQASNMKVAEILFKEAKLNAHRELALTREDFARVALFQGEKEIKREVVEID